MKFKKIKTKDIAFMAFMMAIQIVLRRMFAIQTQGITISFEFLPASMLSIIYGPLWGGLTGAACDLIGAFLMPLGPYFPGFTLTAFLTGLTYGLVLHEKEVTWKRTLLAVAAIVLVYDLLLDTTWLYIMYGSAILAWLPARVARSAIMLPLQPLLIPLVWRRCSKMFRQV